MKLIIGIITVRWNDLKPADRHLIMILSWTFLYVHTIYISNGNLPDYFYFELSGVLIRCWWSSLIRMRKLEVLFVYLGDDYYITINDIARKHRLVHYYMYDTGIGYNFTTTPPHPSFTLYL